MVDIRQNTFNNISRALAITRYDIEQRQLINDYGLNIHAENYFMEIFNFVYGILSSFNVFTIKFVESLYKQSLLILNIVQAVGFHSQIFIHGEIGT
mgnify:CR=1 FL=1